MVPGLRPRRRGEVAVLVGFVLLLNPLVVGAFDLGDPDRYRYEAAPVEFYANGTYDAEPRSFGLDPEVACLDASWSRTCVLERAVHADGGVIYDGPTRAFITHEYDYVYVWGDGFFRPSAEAVDDGRVRYGLEPVTRTAALRDVATPLSRVSPGVRKAVTAGRYVTSDELDGSHELVSTGDDYVVVYATAAHIVSGSERTGAVVGLQWLLGGLGAWLVLYGQRVRVERA